MLNAINLFRHFLLDFPGDLTKLIDIEAAGEILVLKETVNTMVSKLGVFSREVSRVALEGG